MNTATMPRTFSYTTLDKEVRRMPTFDAQAFAAQMSGDVLAPGDMGYEDARKVWNATVDRRPALIARCLSERDVQTAIRFAASHRMSLSVRGGGHHIAGNAVAEGGLMMDLSGLRDIRIDPVARIAHVGAGALLGDFDRAAQVHGLATPLGINSTTGVAGLTLGGGFGWLTRRHGMTVDNLLGATVVTADGHVRTVSAESEPELFWPSAAAAATSVSSPPSNSGCIRWARRCTPAWSSTRSRRPCGCCVHGATSAPPPPTN